MSEHRVNPNQEVARAESQRETRDRIARAATELHEQKGVARTTVAEIARRAGVTRLTVYNPLRRPERAAARLLGPLRGAASGA